MRTSGTIAPAAAVLGLLAAGMPAAAALLGLVPESPRIAADNLGTTDYDSGTDVFEAIASPLVIQLVPGGPPRQITPTASGELFRITIEVDDTGALVGGGILPDDLEVSGEVDLDGDGAIDASGVLLTGSILEFGFQDTGTTSDEFDFRFEVTGGALAPLYAGLDLAVTLLSEGSDFEFPIPGFTASFGGEGKATLGSTPADCGLPATVSTSTWGPSRAR